MVTNQILSGAAMEDSEWSGHGNRVSRARAAMEGSRASLMGQGSYGKMNPRSSNGLPQSPASMVNIYGSVNLMAKDQVLTSEPWELIKDHDVLEACKSLNGGIYATRMMLLPKAEAPHLLTTQRKAKKHSEGTWARITNGKYKGDLAQVVAVNDPRGKALIKLIPRIDIGALTQKYGGGAAVQKGLNPAPRLISSSELE